MDGTQEATPTSTATLPQQGSVPPPVGRPQESVVSASGGLAGAARGRWTYPLATARDARLLARAIKGGWVSDEVAGDIVAEMHEMACHNPEATRADKIHASRVVIAAAAVDVSRERNAVQERQGDSAAERDVLRLAAAADPALRQQLAEMSARLIQGPAPADSPQPQALPGPTPIEPSAPLARPNPAQSPQAQSPAESTPQAAQFDSLDALPPVPEPPSPVQPPARRSVSRRPRTTGPAGA